MANLTPDSTLIPDTLSNRRETTPSSPLRVVAPPLLAPNPQPPGWDRALRSCWPLALGVTLVATGVLGLLLESFQPRLYERVARIEVKSPSDDPQSSPAAHLADLRNLAQQPSLWAGTDQGLPAPMSPGLTVSEGNQPGDLEILLRGHHTDALETQERAVLALHRDHLVEQRKQAVEQKKQALARIEAQLQALPPPAPPRVSEEALNAARRVLDQARQRRLAIENELEQIRKPRLPEIRPLSANVLEKLMRADPTGAQLIEARLVKVHEIETVKRVAVGTTRETVLRRLERELQEIDQLLAGVQTRLMQPHVEQEKARWETELGSLLTKLTRDLKAAMALESAAQAHYEAVLATPMQADTTGNEERQRLEEARRRTLADLQEQERLLDSPVNFQVREEEVRQVNLLVRYATTFGVSLVAGLFLGGLVVAHQKGYGKIRSAAELADTTGLPVLGCLGMVSGNAVPIPGVRPGGAPGREVQRLESAADQVRGPILRQMGAGPVQLLVTSPGSRDGRTTVASQLACSLARAGKRVLLVDAAPIHSDMAWLFQLNPEPGLAEVLRGEIEVGNAIQATSFSRLWLLPAGHVDDQARTALSQDWANHLFEPVLGQVDFIVIDGPPMDLVAEVSAWATRVQSALLTTRSGHTTLQSAHAACQQLHLLRVPVLGLVLLEAGATKEPGGQPSA